MKHCTICGELKPLTEYHKRSAKKDGRRSECKVCCNKSAVEYRQNNKEKVSIYNKKWKQENKEKHIEYLVDWRERNEERLKEYSKNYIENVRDKDKHNRDVVEWRNRNIDSCRARERERNRLLFATDANHRIRCYLRGRIYSALKGNKKANSTMDLVGCSVPELKKYLASKFTEGMTWGNYGEWHVDHIRPCASFDFSDPEQQRVCFHFTNLQPLWAKDNFSKGAKLIGY